MTTLQYLLLTPETRKGNFLRKRKGERRRGKAEKNRFKVPYFLVPRENTVRIKRGKSGGRKKQHLIFLILPLAAKKKTII